MFLIVGLGNPGEKYSKNRHNIGFMAIDEIAEHFGFDNFSDKFDGSYCKGEIAGEKVFLLKPQTMMNNSGISAQKLANFYKVPIENVICIYDDLDVEFGKVKIKQAGGDGGHNGIKSLDSHLGKNYWRLRFGISHPGHKDKVNKYVLSDFTKAELAEIPFMLKNIAENFDLIIKGDRELFLTRYYL